MAAFAGWESLLLRMLGAPATPENVKFLRAWQAAEGGSASFNPLNTTQPFKGASSYNSVGVKNYPNAAAGERATAQTLLNGRYGSIVDLLRSGHATAAQEATAVAHSPWGTGSGVLRVLHSGEVPVPGAGSSNGRTAGSESAGAGSIPSPAATPALRQLLGTFLLGQAQRSAHGDTSPDFSSLLGLALARQQLGAAQQHFGPKPTASSRPVQQLKAHGKVQFVGAALGKEDPSFLQKLSTAVSSIGGTAVKVRSGERLPQHNAAVGGVAHSNHLPDARGFAHAIDGEVFIPGRGWVPLGTALRGVAGRFGLRSGDQPGFYHGGPDTVHVDDGFNMRG